MGIFNSFSNGCGCGSNTNWWWIIIILLLLDSGNTCDSLIWLLLLSRFLRQWKQLPGGQWLLLRLYLPPCDRLQLRLLRL